MAEYQAQEGREDRHGEMTGAISVNMVLCMPVVGAWAMFIAPMLFASLWWIVLSSVLLAIVLPVACLPLSQRLWARLSAMMDRI